MTLEMASYSKTAIAFSASWAKAAWVRSIWPRTNCSTGRARSKSSIPIRWPTRPSSTRRASSSSVKHKALKKLRHPSLPHVSDYFSRRRVRLPGDGLCRGRSLADILDSKQRPTEPLAYDWMTQIVDVLNYCHQNHIIHRDIKPANLIRTPDERIVLVDFGLVKMVDPHNPQTETIVRGVGTPQYTPLEQYDTHRRAHRRAQRHLCPGSDLLPPADRPPAPAGLAAHPQPGHPASDPADQPQDLALDGASLCKRRWPSAPRTATRTPKRCAANSKRRMFKLKSQPKTRRRQPRHTTVIGRSAPTERAMGKPHRTGRSVAARRRAQGTVAGRIPVPGPSSSTGPTSPQRATGSSKRRPKPDRAAAASAIHPAPPPASQARRRPKPCRWSSPWPSSLPWPSWSRSSLPPDPRWPPQPSSPHSCSPPGPTTSSGLDATRDRRASDARSQARRTTHRRLNTRRRPMRASLFLTGRLRNVYNPDATQTLTTIDTRKRIKSMQPDTHTPDRLCSTNRPTCNASAAASASPSAPPTAPP